MPLRDSRSESALKVSKEDANHVLSSSEEESSTPDCELGLSLSLSVGGDGSGGGNLKSKKPAPKILTAEDFNSVVSAGSSSSSSSSSTQNQTNGMAGTKRSAADSVSPSNAASQVVGWPPIRSYRMNNMANNGKSFSNKAFVPTNENRNGTDVALEKDSDLSNHEENNNQKQRMSLKSLFVKVNMDGVAIGRKVDLSALTCYQTLAHTLDTMFFSAPSKNANSYGTTRGSKLLDGSSGYLLTYEDKDGDWMLVGDVPWSMFLNTVKRLRIMRLNEANGNTIR